MHTPVIAFFPVYPLLQGRGEKELNVSFTFDTFVLVFYGTRLAKMGLDPAKGGAALDTVIAFGTKAAIIAKVCHCPCKRSAANDTFFIV